MKFQQTECSICLDPLGKNITVLECDHVFHRECISQAEKYKDTCPLCRKKMGEDALREYSDKVYINRNKRGGRGGFSIEDEIYLNNLH